ncbi:hypothetical protein ACVNHC_02150 [Pannonibacter sp. Q-1]
MGRNDPRHPDTRHQGPGHECPECHGTGIVMVFPHRSGAHPLKDFYERSKMQEMAMPYSERCGFCGGDGWISPREELVAGASDPRDWINDKRELARIIRGSQLDKPPRPDR